MSLPVASRGRHDLWRAGFVLTIGGAELRDRRETLRHLQNELNEALFVAKYARPPIAVKAGRMPYRG